MSDGSIGLRPWQVKHREECLDSFHRGNKIFLSQAVTGGGKTILGVMVGQDALNARLIRRIVVLCPSIEIADGWVDKLNKNDIVASRTNNIADDVVAIVSTYSGARDIPGGIDTLVILDEIHHAERDAAWGEIASDIADDSKFVLALTGTPWMTQGTIAILERHGYYKSVDGKQPTIVADAAYTYAMDLRENNENRATVPVSFIFHESLASNVRKAREGEGPRTETLELEAVTDANRDTICNEDETDHDVPLGPHVQIKDESISNNPMARKLLLDATSKLSAMRTWPAFKKSPKPMGLVTCRTIEEARYVSRYMEKTLGIDVELIVSKDDSEGGISPRSAKRLRALAKGDIANPPSWIVSVGMVSEGVDIPAIKVIAFLNQITTRLFLVQLTGRALRRIRTGVDAEGRVMYADKILDGTRAFVYAPAHPAIVAVGTNLENISNEAVRAKSPSDDDSESSDGLDESDGEEPQKPRQYKEWVTVGEASTEFYRGIFIPVDCQRAIVAIENDEHAMSILGPAWIAMVMDWIERGLNAEAADELNRRLAEFEIEAVKPETKTTRNYDEDSAFFRSEAQRVTQQIRFAHPRFASMPDAKAYSAVKQYVADRALGKWKAIEKMTLDEKKKFVRTAELILEIECVSTSSFH